MFFRKRKPLYTVDEIHTYVADMASVTKMRNSAASSTEHKHYSSILHVMREVLLRMVESLDPEDRPQINLEEAK